MTTERQKRANRLNALKSTGPRTTEGKKRSSENARKHGLASALEKEHVDRWLRKILDIDPKDLDGEKLDDRMFAALDLAEAEAALERAQHFEELQALVDHLGGPEPPLSEAMIFEDLVSQMEEASDLRGLSREDWALGMSILRQLDADQRQRMRDFERRTRLSRRYRRETESVRRTALKRWIEMQNPETNPISS